jgi:glycosyltransferase involved in cell wall biosynthesis
MKKHNQKCSVVIPYYNDKDEILKTLDSLFLFNDDLIEEVIIVDDGSDYGLEVPPLPAYAYSKVRIVSSGNRYGVGFSFDIGVSEAKCDTIFLMGCDIRFANRDSLNSIIMASREYPQHLIGCECKGALDDIEFKHDGSHYTSGAEILWKMDNTHLSETNPFHGDDMYRDVLQAKWIMSPQEGVTDIPCILGATYAVQKSWYNKILGFNGHRIWGGLEPFISLKSHMAGGGVKQLNDVYTGHKFGREINRKRDWDSYYYNKVMMCHLLFDGELKRDLLSHVKVWRPAIKADEEIRRNWDAKYKPLKEYYKSIFSVDIRDTICYNTFV